MRSTHIGDPSLRVAIPPQFNRPTSVTEEQFVAGVEALIAAQRQRQETPAGQLRAALAAMNIQTPG